MKIPSRKALSPEQEDIVLEASMSEPVLITGPPGTGKTVIALYRTKALFSRSEQRIGVEPPRLVMHSRVLCRYTENAVADLGVPTNAISTWHSWLHAWWKAATGAAPPSIKPFHPDFDAMLEAAICQHSKFFWGHLVLDEGQDFAPGFYALLYRIRRQGIKAGVPVAPSLTVLADDNQRMNETDNSSIENIITELRIPEENRFELMTNFRNTREIAKFSSKFYSGLSTGIAKIPDGNGGDLPVLFQAASFEDEMDRIARHAKNYGRHHVGVFTSTDRIRVKVVEALEERLKDTPIGVHTYKSGRNGTGVEHLNFDQSSLVTVVNHQSCKGLEFDAVFIPQLQKYSFDAANATYFKMKFYVMCSRARTHLTLSFSGCDAENPPGVVSLLPASDEGYYRLQTA